MINPILERELKTRMRTWRTPIVMMIYLLVLGIVVTFFFFVFRQQNGYGYYSMSFAPSIAVNVYYVILVGQYIIIMLILPALTAAAISGERERQTLDLLLCTDISAWKIIFGKIGSALSFVFILIVAAVPFMAIVLMFGGITVLDIVKVVLFYMISAVLGCSIGIYCSARFKRVVTSIIMSYLMMGVLYVGTLIAYGIVMMILSSSMDYQLLDNITEEITLGILGFNPAFGLASFVDSFSMTTQGDSLLAKFQPWMVSVTTCVLLSSILIVLTRFRLRKVR